MKVEFHLFTRPNDEETKLSSWYSVVPNFLTRIEANKLREDILKRYSEIKCEIETANYVNHAWVMIEFYSKSDEAAFLMDKDSGVFNI